MPIRGVEQWLSDVEGYDPGSDVSRLIEISRLSDALRSEPAADHYQSILHEATYLLASTGYAFVEELQYLVKNTCETESTNDPILWTPRVSTLYASGVVFGAYVAKNIGESHHLTQAFHQTDRVMNTVRGLGDALGSEGFPAFYSDSMKVGINILAESDKHSIHFSDHGRLYAGHLDRVTRKATLRHRLPASLGIKMSIWRERKFHPEAEATNDTPDHTYSEDITEQYDLVTEKAICALDPLMHCIEHTHSSRDIQMAVFKSLLMVTINSSKLKYSSAELREQYEKLVDQGRNRHSAASYIAGRAYGYVNTLNSDINHVALREHIMKSLECCQRYQLSGTSLIEAFLDGEDETNDLLTNNTLESLFDTPPDDEKF